MTLGENGIIKKAQLAKEKTNTAQKQEEEKLQDLENYLNTGRGENAGTLYGIESTAGNGTENNPYNITNEDQLLALSNLVNGGRNFEGIWFSLGNDIELDSSKIWLPIGNETNKFKGNFNGNNHYIKGLYFNNTSINYVGLFGYIEGSTIKNIKISSEKSSLSANSSIGAISGEAKNSTIENCINETNISGNDSGFGGIIGRTVENCIVRNCTNLGTIHGKMNAAGIVGYVVLKEGGYCQIYNCSNTGNISVVSTEQIYRGGGIAGRVYNPNGNALIKGCTSTNLGIYGSAYNANKLTVED